MIYKFGDYIKRMFCTRHGDYLMCATISEETTLYEIFNGQGDNILAILIWNNGRATRLHLHRGNGKP